MTARDAVPAGEKRAVPAVRRAARSNAAAVHYARAAAYPPDESGSAQACRASPHPDDASPNSYRLQAAADAVSRLPSAQAHRA
jgi:hypothetical protein